MRSVFHDNAPVFVPCPFIAAHVKGGGAGLVTFVMEAINNKKTIPIVERLAIVTELE